jgi:hypothetical protein
MLALEELKYAVKNDHEINQETHVWSSTFA